MKHPLCLLLGLAVSLLPAVAQKPAAQPPKPEPAELIAAYRFAEATEQLEADKALALRKKQSTDQHDALLEQARRGADMMAATAQVVFLDSVVLPKADFLRAYALSSVCGRVTGADGVPGAAGATAFLNNFGDAACFARPDTAGLLRLASAYKVGDAFSQPAPLAMLGHPGGAEDYPFLLPDGQTLYFAAQGPESLGGYDIFITRYDAESRSFLKPENLGMPFNSFANDYLYVVDEQKNIGWFATDRRQPADSVCVYTFIPPTTRQIVPAADAEALRLAALLHSISLTQADAAQVAAAHSRLEKPATAAVATEGTDRFVISDATVYTRLSQFRSEQARRIARQWASQRARLEQLEADTDQLRAAYAGGNKGVAPDIRQHEAELRELHASLATMAKNFRRAEAAALK